MVTFERVVPPRNLFYLFIISRTFFQIHPPFIALNFEVHYPTYINLTGLFARQGSIAHAFSGGGGVIHIKKIIANSIRERIGNTYRRNKNKKATAY